MISLKELEKKSSLDDFLAKNKNIEVVHLNLIQGGNGGGGSQTINLDGTTDFIVSESGGF